MYPNIYIYIYIYALHKSHTYIYIHVFVRDVASFFYDHAPKQHEPREFEYCITHC